MGDRNGSRAGARAAFSPARGAMLPGAQPHTNSIDISASDQRVEPAGADRARFDRRAVSDKQFPVIEQTASWC